MSKPPTNKPQMKTLRLSNLGRTVGTKTLVREVSLTFHAGEINLLLGPNGAGKTSLFRLCAQLDVPTTGTVELVDTDGNALSMENGDITMVFQRPVTFHRTVQENLAYPLRIRGLSAEIQESRIQEAMAVADLVPLAHQNARALSGGEAQRLALARAYVIQPSVLLLDEPAANLDPASRWRVEEMVLEMIDRFGTTVVLTTHDLMQARKIGNHAYFMERGRVTGPYPAREFFHAPPNDQTARYIAGVLQTHPE